MSIVNLSSQPIIVGRNLLLFVFLTSHITQASDANYFVISQVWIEAAHGQQHVQAGNDQPQVEKVTFEIFKNYERENSSKKCFLIRIKIRLEGMWGTTVCRCSVQRDTRTSSAQLPTLRCSSENDFFTYCAIKSLEQLSLSIFSILKCHFHFFALFCRNKFLSVNICSSLP